MIIDSYADYTSSSYVKSLFKYTNDIWRAFLILIRYVVDKKYKFCEIIMSTFPFKKKEKKKRGFLGKWDMQKLGKKLKFKMFILLGMKIGKAKKVFRINLEVID